MSSAVKCGTAVANRVQGPMRERRAPRLAIAALAAAMAAGLQPAPAQTVFAGNDPSFSSAQAARGKTAYEQSCLSCHGANLDDGQFGPPLAGPVFERMWGHLSAPALYAFITSKMPPGNAGSLNQSTVADIEAYLLEANGAAKGVSELSAAALSSQAANMKAPEVPEILWGPVNRDQTYRGVMARRTAKLAKLTPVTAKALERPAPGDWLMWRRTYDAHGRSPLDQINTGNVGTLAAGWSWALPVSPNEITPLVHDGVLFIKSANRVQALDGATGDVLWTYARRLPAALDDGHNLPVKSLAIYEDRLFEPTADGHMVALDIRTGKVVWDQAVLNAQEMADHLRMDGGPIVAHGKVIMGVSDCTNHKGGCFIFGLDAKTGKALWRFNTIARPGEPGGQSWNGAPVDERYGASVWTVGSYDPALNLVYFGVGQTYDTATLLQPHAQKGKSNDAAYTDATVALDPDTGKLVWYYQHMKRDVWDLDWVFDQTLVTLPVNGKPTQLDVTGGKIAVFDALDRSNGKYAFSKDLGLQNLVTRIDPKTGRKTINPALKPEANVTKLLCPHGGGARSWLATSYDPATHLLYVPLREVCAHFTWQPRSAEATAAGGNDMHWVLIPRPDSDGNFGRIEAVNLETRQVAWTRRQRAPVSSSILTTAGGLLFEGSRDRTFAAFDQKTGKELWSTRLDAIPSSTPVTYTADGNQYVAVVTGGSNAQQATWPPLTPEVTTAAPTTTLWVFKLNKAAAGRE